MAVAAAGVTVSLPEPAQTSLEREGLRLAALLESARVQSRTSGVPVYWHASGQGFRFEGLPPASMPSAWLAGDTTVANGTRMQLGPEPIIGPQLVELASIDRPGRLLRVGTDGLAPFAIQRPDSP